MCLHTTQMHAAYQSEHACVVGLRLHMHGARETELETRACVVGLNGVLLMA